MFCYDQYSSAMELYSLYCKWLLDTGFEQALLRQLFQRE
jgi:hypothetical protein